MIRVTESPNAAPLSRTDRLHPLAQWTAPAGAFVLCGKLAGYVTPQPWDIVAGLFCGLLVWCLLRRGAQP